VLMGSRPAISSNTPPHFGHLMMCDDRRISFPWLNLVTAVRAGNCEDEVGLSFESRGHLAEIGCAGMPSTGAGILSWQPLH
jgi:hypothetical protein